MIYLIVGRTSSGKDYLARKLAEKGLIQVKSYATRPKRSADEDTHTFISPEEAVSYTDRIAETKIGNYEYFATKQQVDESDVYIIDPLGLDMLTKLMPEETFHVIYVMADDMDRRTHAIARAENKIEAEKIFDKRNADEDGQFTAFEDKLSNIKDEFPFESNVTLIDVFENKYDVSTTADYVQFLVNNKTLHDKMTKIVKQCADTNIIEYAADTDHIRVIKQDGTQTAVTIEHFADIILGNKDGMFDLMKQYILRSDTI